MSEFLSQPVRKELPQFADSETEFIANSYLWHLGLKWDVLQGKKILDIGAADARFALAAKKRNISVTSVDIEEGGWAHPLRIQGVPYDVADARKKTVRAKVTSKQR
jgi:hypothetical protein